MNEKQSVTEQFERKRQSVAHGMCCIAIRPRPTSHRKCADGAIAIRETAGNKRVRLQCSVMYVRTYNPVINDTGRPSGTSKKFLARFDVFTVMLIM
jgi:hypothetical protein